MLIQMPIIMGLFVLLRQPTMYISDDSMIFAFHESFLWIEDLSQPDPWILPIIAGVGTFVSFTMNQMLNESTNNQVAGMMKMMQFIFPYNDSVDGQGISVRAGSLLGCQPGNSDILQYSYGFYQKENEEREGSSCI